MRNFVRAYNAVSREWAEDMRRQYEHECWACNMQLEELRKNNNAGATISRLSNHDVIPSPRKADGPRDPAARIIEGGILVFEVEARE